MFFITSFSWNLYKDYANRFIDSYIQTNQTIPVTIYVEEDINKYPQVNNITYVNLFEAVPSFKDFIERHKDKESKRFNSESKIEFRADFIRFAPKVFSQYHASKQNKKFIWLDADNRFVKQIPETFVDEFIPNDTFTSYYGRKEYTECGVLGFNSALDNELNNSFFEKYLSWYDKDDVLKLPETQRTDCHTYDKTRNIFKTNPKYKELRKGDGADGHIIARDKSINIFLDHHKGKRKYRDASPEWVKETK